MPQLTEKEEEEEEAKKPLGIVLDIDGTLIRESRKLTGIHLRPHAVDFLVWCQRRGHRLALWTAGHESWADRVASKLCPLVQKEIMMTEDGAQENHHVCDSNEGGYCCRATFDFVWAGDKMRRERPLKYRELFWLDRTQITKDGCRWCEFYREDCDSCECVAGPNDCRCRSVKDLRKIWFDQSEETAHFCRERTLLVENTPQNCRYNYGNAIYVPTYRGGIDDNIFAAFRQYIELTLEDPSVDVTRVTKCDHPKGPHACYHQNWWTPAP